VTRPAAILLATLLLIRPTMAQSPPRAEDHLEPEASILGGDAFMSGYESLVQRTLKDAYGSDVVVRMVALPSFAPEYAVGLASKAQAGKAAPYRIIAANPAVSMWTYVSIAMLKNGGVKILGDQNQKAQREEIARLEASVPRDPDDMKVNHCQADIADALAGRIVDVWRKMLLHTRYSVHNGNGLDGTTYHFGIAAPGTGQLAGKVWSPERETATGAFVQLADTMRAICQKENGASEAQLEKLVAELEQRLN
jgi:hypothetical protein